MLPRLREAMRDGSLSSLGGASGIVEADETYFGPKLDETGKPKPTKRGTGHKRAVVALVERDGSVSSFHVDRADKETVMGIVDTYIKREVR